MLTILSLLALGSLVVVNFLSIRTLRKENAQLFRRLDSDTERLDARMDSISERLRNHGSIWKSGIEAGQEKLHYRLNTHNERFPKIEQELELRKQVDIFPRNEIEAVEEALKSTLELIDDNIEQLGYDTLVVFGEVNDRIKALENPIPPSFWGSAEFPSATEIEIRRTANEGKLSKKKGKRS